MKTIVIVQARSGSTRFPRKVLKKIGSRTVLEIIIERINMAQSPIKTIVATTNKQEDDSIVELCRYIGCDYFRGSEKNLLKRHYDCAVKNSAEIILKIPSDCPLVDPIIIDKVIDKIQSSDYDYVSNLHPPSFPDGLDVEAMTFEALQLAFHNAKKNFELEHTTPYIWDNPTIFKIGSIIYDSSKDWSKIYRLTIDHPEDYIVIDKVIAHFADSNLGFGVGEIIEMLQQNPKISKINSHLIDDTWYNREECHLKTYSR